MEIQRQATAPGMKYPSYASTKKQPIGMLIGGILGVTVGGGLALLAISGYKGRVFLVSVPALVLFFAFLLVMRMRGEKDALIFASDGFMWRGVDYSWSDLVSVERDEPSPQFTNVHVQFKHDRGLIRRRLVVDKRKRSPDLLMAELHATVERNLIAPDSVPKQ